MNIFGTLIFFQIPISLSLSVRQKVPIKCKLPPPNFNVALANHMGEWKGVLVQSKHSMDFLVFWRLDTIRPE